MSTTTNSTKGEMNNMGDMKQHPDKELTKHIDDYIQLQGNLIQQGLFGKGELEQKTVRIRQFRRWAEQNGIIDVDLLMNLQVAVAYFDHLMQRNRDGKIGLGYVKKLFGSFKHLISYLEEAEVLAATPKWIAQKNKRFKVVKPHTDPETVPLEHLRHLYWKADPQLKLFMLLMLNCGCGQSEIGKIEVKEYDPEQGRITRPRGKTKRYANAPVVSYKLWDRTQRLLEKQLEIQKMVSPQKDYKHLLLWDEEGLPFWIGKNRENGKYNKIDKIAGMFDTLVDEVREADKTFPKYTFYRFRATAVSFIYNNKNFSHLASLWLAHTPKTVAEKHYLRPNIDILDKYLAWLEQYLFGTMND